MFLDNSQIFFEKLLKECFQKKVNSKRKIPEILRSFDNFMRKMLTFFKNLWIF